MSLADDLPFEISPTHPATHFIDSGAPLYYQLATILREQIASGRFQIGDRLPTEAELVQAYGVSRATVRSALQTLREEGLIRSAPGRGSFVTAIPSQPGILKMDGTLNGLIAMGMATTPQLIELREVTVAAHEAEALGMEPGTPAIRAYRLRYFKDRPFCFIINTLPLKIGKKLTRSEWESGSILRHLQTRHGIKLGDAEEVIHATLADANLARWLQVRIGSPLLRVDYLIRDVHGRPVETPVIFYRSDLHAFTITLTWVGPETGGGEGWALRDQGPPPGLDDEHAGEERAESAPD